MAFDPERHHRHSIRLPGYDYRAPGTYFVTVVAADRDCLLVEPACRSVVERCWRAIPRHLARTRLDLWVVMPNHMHGIIVIDSPLPPERGDAEQTRRLGRQSLGAIVGNFKSVTARRINRIRRTPGVPVWQRNYYERVVRNDRELQRIREYIALNPARWALDRENPQRTGESDEWAADEDLWFGTQL